MSVLSIHIIVAMTAQRVIGRQGRLPWHLPEDLQLFRSITWGHPIIMGRRTFESLPAPLPGRANLVVSTQLSPQPGIEVHAGFHEALAAAGRQGSHAYVIGGAALYREALPLAQELHVSWISGNFPGDTRFPALFADDWQLVTQQPHSGFIYCHYRKNRPSTRHRDSFRQELQPPID